MHAVRPQQKNPIKLIDKGVVEWRYTTCGYCPTGCSIEVGLDDHSRRQRNLLGALLILKHTLRGLLFSWPLYLLLLAGLALPGEFAWAFVLMLIPALAVPGYILGKGLREDYRAVAQGRLLKPGDVRRALLGIG